MKPNLANLNDFLRGYLMAAYWTNDDSAPSGEYSTSGRPEEMHARLSDEGFAAAARDCLAFFDGNEGQLRLSGLSDEQAGHDFWLTRNHHGSGFWDRDNVPENQQSELTKAAHKFGEVDLYAGDDGKLYFSR